MSNAWETAGFVSPLALMTPFAGLTKCSAPSPIAPVPAIVWPDDVLLPLISVPSKAPVPIMVPAPPRMTWPLPVSVAVPAITRSATKISWIVPVLLNVVLVPLAPSCNSPTSGPVLVTVIVPASAPVPVPDVTLKAPLSISSVACCAIANAAIALNFAEVTV